MKNQSEKTAVGMFKSSTILAFVTLVCVFLLAGTWKLTADKIAQQHQQAVLNSLNRILPVTSYDNLILNDYIEISAPGFFKHSNPVRVYRARKQEQPVSLVLQFTTSEGYNGDIDLLVNIDTNGIIVGVQVTKHRETPGLGDDIDSRRSDWISDFTGHSLNSPDSKGWTVKRNGGYFDQFTGATISPRAVVKAVRRALEYEATNRQRLYQLPSEAPEHPQTDNYHGVVQ